MQLESITQLFVKSGEFRQLREQKGQKILIEGIAPSSFALVIASLFKLDPRQTIVVTKNAQQLQELLIDLGCFTDHQNISVLTPWETLPYEYVSPSEMIERERITALYRLLGGRPCICLATVESLARSIPEKDFLLKKGISLSVNEEYPFDDIIECLVAYGYTREYRVESYGQFSVKGGIIDVFLPTGENPVRLDFFGDTLESIREFDLESQISYNRMDTATIYPRKELILSRSERENLVTQLEKARSEGKTVPEDYFHETDHSDDSAGANPGIEDLFPLIINQQNLLDYCQNNCRIIFLNTQELIAQMDHLRKMFSELYKRKSDTAVCLPVERLLQPDAFDNALERADQLNVFTTTSGALNWHIRSIPNFQGKIKRVRDDLSLRISDGWKIIVCTGFEGQARRLFDLLGEMQPGSTFDEIDMSLPVNILITPLSEGFELAEEKILVLTDHEIFGKSYRKKRQFKKKTSRPIESFLDLEISNTVVHINHGIGIFKGIERMAAGGVERDFLVIEYEAGDKLYVSLDQINMVQKYIGMEGKRPRIDALGRKSAWNRIKERVQKSVEEIARELIHIYSSRRALRGFPFPPDTQWQEEFESKFEYEETPDQITAIEDIKDDMEKPEPMDRLVCGDVGFGKTEVAIRAAFKAVMAGKQVAVLVPTTVLAMQHNATFTKRFNDYPISIDMISRFRSRGEITDVKNKLASGNLDIVIGTHALLGRDIIIKNLGLLVVDEEQRFGVRHKEQLKKLRTLVDVITLSATPIPRTLHMSLAGIRDLTIISTPPENRQSIETYVIEENPDIVRMAVLRELEREGQVFFVHNRVQTIEAQMIVLENLIPEASFCIAHGQMDEHELEEVMIDFLNRKYDVLISTSIIESGLDMPNVNTIIINRSDTFGLSQLYQLRGRVGRSIKKAYAYLTYPRHTALTETAQKRLQVIAEHSELGSGFKIAMKDMEIRGSGNILGREQSGNIMDVGFDLYCQMLEEAVRKLKGEKPLRAFRTPIFIKTDIFIPDTYISDERQKIEFYKRFEACEELDEIDELEKELTDRFGVPPREVKILIALAQARTLASSLEVDEIIEESRGIKIRLSGNSRINTGKIVSLLKRDARFSVDPSDKELLLFRMKETAHEKKLEELKKWLQQMV